MVGESQELDSLSDVEASVLELCASVGDDAARAGHGLPSLGKAELVGVRDLGEGEDALFLLLPHSPQRYHLHAYKKILIGHAETTPMQ